MTDLTPTEYVRLKQTLNLRPACVASLTVFCVDLSIILVSFGWMMDYSWFSYCCAQLILAVICFHAFGLLHECGHGNIFKSRLANDLLGHLVSPFALIPYYPWTFTHKEHHRWTGNMGRDPSLRALREHRERGSLNALQRFLWKTWIPLAGIVQSLVFWRYPLVLFRNGASAKQLLQCTVSVVWLIAFWVVAFTCFPSTFNIQTVGPFVFGFFVIFEFINLPHHSDQPVFADYEGSERLRPWEQHRTTRSCWYPPLVSELLCLNFNFHIEHHLFPTLPWHRLRSLRRLVKDRLGKEYTESTGVDWSLDSRQRLADDVFLSEKNLR